MAFEKEKVLYVKDLVLAKLASDIRRNEDEASLLAMVTQDASQSLKVCSLLLEGENDAAYDVLSTMDTAPREYLYGFIQQVFGKTIEEVMDSEIAPSI